MFWCISREVFLTLLEHEIGFFSSIWEPGGDPGDPADVWGPHGRFWGGSGWVRVGLTVRAVYGASSDSPVEPQLSTSSPQGFWASVQECCCSQCLLGFSLMGSRLPQVQPHFSSRFKKSSWFAVCLPLHCPAVRMLWQPLSSSYTWLEWESLPDSKNTPPAGNGSLGYPTSSFVLILPLPADLPLLLLLD